MIDKSAKMSNNFNHILLIVALTSTTSLSPESEPKPEPSIGEIVTRNQYQFAAQIFNFKFVNQQKELCTGSLIHPRFILTTAQCLEDAVFVDVVLNHHQSAAEILGNEEKEKYWKRRHVLFMKSVKTFFSHPDHIEMGKNETFQYNIGLILLPRRLKLRSMTLEAAPGGSDKYSRHWVTALSWAESQMLLSAHMIIADINWCKESFYYHVYVHEFGFMCALSASNMTSCNWGEGGPVFYTLNDTFVLIGLIGLRLPCDNSQMRLGLVPVGPNVPWIKGKMGEVGRVAATNSPPDEKWREIEMQESAKADGSGDMFGSSSTKCFAGRNRFLISTGGRNLGYAVSGCVFLPVLANVVHLL